MVETGDLKFIVASRRRGFAIETFSRQLCTVGLTDRSIPLNNSCASFLGVFQQSVGSPTFYVAFYFFLSQNNFALPLRIVSTANNKEQERGNPWDLKFTQVSMRFSFLYTGCRFWTWFKIKLYFEIKRKLLTVFFFFFLYLFYYYFYYSGWKVICT